jgi:hypothetical protein
VRLKKDEDNDDNLEEYDSCDEIDDVLCILGTI